MERSLSQLRTPSAMPESEYVSANTGTGGAYNAGVRAAAGDFVVLCSADDILLPEHLEQMSDFIDQEPGYDIYSTNGYYWRNDGTREVVYGPGELGDSLTLRDVIAKCFFSVSTTSRRSLFERTGGLIGPMSSERITTSGSERWPPARSTGIYQRPYRYTVREESRSPRLPWPPIALIFGFARGTPARSANLSAEECAAVEGVVRDRERYIERLTSRGAPSGRLAQTMSRVLGRARTQRLIGAIRRATRRR